MSTWAKWRVALIILFVVGALGGSLYYDIINPTRCIDGVSYVQGLSGGIAAQVDAEGKPVRCGP